MVAQCDGHKVMVACVVAVAQSNEPANVFETASHQIRMSRKCPTRIHSANKLATHDRRQMLSKVQEKGHTSLRRSLEIPQKVNQ